MFKDPHFRFPLGVSQQKFASKPTEDYQVSQITFVPQVLSIAKMLELATEGYAFCPLFNSSNPDGIISTRDKSLANFQSASALFVDYDHMVIGLDEFIGKLPFPPTIAYSTYSDGKKGLHHFRLIYVFNDQITSIKAFDNLTDAVALANGFGKGEHGGWDKLKANQMYYGTTPKASTYRSGIIYCQKDFDQFVSTMMKRDVTQFDSAPSRNKLDSYVSTATNGYAKQGSYINPEFRSDFLYRPFQAFFRKYRDKYYSNYKSSLETPLILDESRMFYRYPEKYYCVVYNRCGKETLRWTVGQNRKKKLYRAALIMLANNPLLSLENLIFNLALELSCHYDNYDKKISRKYLLKMAVKVYNNRVCPWPTKHGEFKVNKPYWHEQGITPNEAKEIVKRYLKAKKIGQFINPELTLKENLIILHQNGFKITDKTLKEMVSRGDIQIMGGKTPRTSLSCCPNDDTILELIRENEKITLTEIAKTLGVSEPTVNRHIKDMKGKMIDREGNNRSGRWIILPEFQDYAVSKKIDNAAVTDDCGILEENVNNVSQSFSGPCLASWETSQFNPGERASEIQKTMDGVGCKIITDGAEQNHEQVFLGHVPMPLKNRIHRR